MARELESLRKELWAGEIPVCFTLDTEDLATIVSEPEPCCLMLPRLSYLPLHTNEVKNYFSQFVKSTQQDSEIWFETESGDKLKWHLPIGVNYDTLHGLNTDGKVWHLTVHFSDYPEQVLLRCPSIDAVKGHFITTLKEADSLKHSSAVMNNIRETENVMLWNGMLKRSFDEFWTINKRLMGCNTSDQPLGYKHLPIRIYKLDHTYSQPLVPVSDDTCVTVNTLLQSCAIDVDDSLAVISQGVVIPLDSNVYELTQALSYPDNFLYLCITRYEAT